MDIENDIEVVRVKAPRFKWDLDKLETVTTRLCSQEPWNCAYTGQLSGVDKYEEDVAYFNSQVCVFHVLTQP